MTSVFMPIIVFLIYSIIGLSTGVAILTTSTADKELQWNDVLIATFWGALWPVTILAVLMIKLFCRFK